MKQKFCSHFSDKKRIFFYFFQEIRVSDRAAPYIVKPPGIPKRSFGTSEHRITKRMQRPRRRDPPPRPPTTTIVEDPSDDLYLNALPKRTPGQGAHTIGDRQSLAEDDLYENSSVVKLENKTTFIGNTSHIQLLKYIWDLVTPPNSNIYKSALLF